MNSLPINFSTMTSGVEKITVEKYGDEKSGVETWGKKSLGLKCPATFKNNILNLQSVRHQSSKE